MKFFIPHTAPDETEQVYKTIAQNLKNKFRLPVHERRIFSLSYTNSKQKWYAEVGQLEEQEDRYEIIAILESKPYIIVTRAADGREGLTILVDKAEVTAVTEFDHPAS